MMKTTCIAQAAYILLEFTVKIGTKPGNGSYY